MSVITKEQVQKDFTRMQELVENINEAGDVDYGIDYTTVTFGEAINEYMVTIQDNLAELVKIVDVYKDMTQADIRKIMGGN